MPLMAALSSPIRGLNIITVGPDDGTVDDVDTQTNEDQGNDVLEMVPNKSRYRGTLERDRENNKR
jgi:hypothetical protein